MSTVYVLNKDGKPLMPTTRCGHVRHLLKEQKARVVASKPFTIQLLYKTNDVVQPLYLGIDPGRTNIGVAVVKADGTAVFTAHLETRNKEIPKLMKNRKDSRRARRTNGRRCRRQRRAKANGTISKKCVKHDTAQNGSISKVRSIKKQTLKKPSLKCRNTIACFARNPLPITIMWFRNLKTAAIPLATLLAYAQSTTTLCIRIPRGK